MKPTEPTKTMRASAPDRGTPKKTGKAKSRGLGGPSLVPRTRKATAKKDVSRRGSKTALVLELLKRPGGISLKELTKATGWQPHSVRGFLSGTVGKRMGIPVESSKEGDRERSYCISSK